MICIADLQKLLNNWQKRMDSLMHSLDYNIALSECIFDLNTVINNELLEMMTEEDARDYMLSQEADDYLSSEENYYATAI